MKQSQVRDRRPDGSFKLLPLARYHGTPCPYCEKPMIIGTLRRPTREHKMPKHMGGTLNGSNRLIVCHPCNNDKGGKTLEQFAQELAAKGDPRSVIVAGVLRWRNRGK